MRPSLTYDLATLIRHEPFVRSVLRSLVSDENQVQDLVQETWVRALQNPPKRDRSPLGWLKTVSQNLARDSHKKDQARHVREQSVAPAEAQDTPGLEAKLDLHQKVVQAVLSLKDPYKQVILLTYFDGQTPAQVAESLQRKENTVRSQITRAHKQLRAKLDSSYGEDRQSWVALALPLVAPKKAVVASGSGASFPFALMAFVLGMVGLSSWAVWSALHNPNRPAQSELSPTEGVAQTPANSPNTLGQPTQVERQATNKSTRRVSVQMDGNPMANVEVWFFSMDALDGRSREDTRAWTALMAKPGTTAPMSKALSEVQRTRFNGEVDFEPPPNPGTFFAMGPGFLGAAPMEDPTAWGLDPSLFVIPVEPFRTIDAKVVNLKGEPVVGVPISLSLESKEDPTGGGGWSWVMDQQRTQGPQGLARFPLYSESLPTHSKQSARWRMEPAIPGLTLKSRTFAHLGIAKKRPLKFTIPPTGSMEIQLLDEKGQPIKASGQMTVSGLGLRGNRTAPIQTVELRDGQARIPHLGLDKEFLITVEGNQHLASQTWRGIGPTEPGETKPVAIECRSGTMVKGRLLQLPEFGSGFLPTFRMELLDSKEQALQTHSLFPDPSGKFQIRLSGLDAGDLKGQIISNVPIRGKNERVWIPLGTLRPSPTGTLDLGDLHPHATLWKVAGKAVDTLGNPAPNLSLSLQVQGFRSFTALTDGNGEFTIQPRWDAIPESPILEVASECGWYQSQPADFSSGYDQALVVVAPRTHLKGHLQATEASFSSTATITAIPVGPGPHSSDLTPPKTYVYRGQSDFQIPDMIPGLYRIEMTVRGQRVAQVDGIHVGGQPQPPIPELNPLPYKIEMESFEWFIQAASGSLPKTVSIQCSAGEKRAGIHQVADGAGITKHMKDQITAFQFRATGFRPKTVLREELSGNPPHLVTLEPGIRVLLKLDRKLETQTERVTARLGLELEGSRPRPMVVRLPYGLGEGQEMPITFPGPGTYHLVVDTTHHNPNGPSMASIESKPFEVGGQRFPLEILESSEGQSLVLKVPDRVLD